MTRNLILMMAILATALCTFSSASLQANEIDEHRPMRVSGQVLDPEGNPVAAQVRLLSVRGDEVVSTTSDQQGHFRLAFRPVEIGRPLGRDWGDAALLASAKGYAPAWVRVGQLRHKPTSTLQLVPDDISVRAQIVTSDGRPVENAKITIHSLMQPEHGNLDAYLKEQRDEPGRNRYAADHMTYVASNALDLTLVTGTRDRSVDAEGNVVDVFRTDANGRLELKGVGAERKLHMRVEAAGIVSQSFHVLTRERIDAKWKRTTLSRNARLHLESGGSLPIVYGAKFTHVGGASHPIAGTIRSQSTGEPLANVGVSAQMKGQNGLGYATTDAQGRYEIHGLPASGVVSLYVVCPPGMPYLNAKRSRLEFSAAAPLKDTDFELVKGTVVSGRLLDPQGNPAQGRVEYLALDTNEHAHQMPDPMGPYGGDITEEDGEFQVVAMPGLGLLVAKTYDDRYIPATLDASLPTVRGEFVGTVNMGLVRARHYDVFKPIVVSLDSEPLTIDLHLRSGKEIPGTLVSIEGEPIDGAQAEGITPDRFRKSLDTNRFVVAGLRQGETRRLIFRDDERRLGAVIGVDEATPPPIKVTMRPYATLTGRIVDQAGRPIPQAVYALMSDGAAEAIESRDIHPLTERPLEFAEGTTNADGRFHINNAISACKCELLGGLPRTPGQRIMPVLLKTVSLRSGQTLDLGDLVLESTAR